MEEILTLLVEGIKGNVMELTIAAAFIWNTIAGNKTEAEKNAKRLAKLKTKRDKHLQQAETETKEIKKLEKEEKPE